MLPRLLRRLTRSAHATSTAERQRQIGLALQFRMAPVPFADAEFSTFSQNGEDGILLSLFARIGMGGRRVVELGAGNGIECNATNLIVHHGWDALLIDGSAKNIAAGQRFYAAIRNPWQFRRAGPTLQAAWITRETVNDLLGGFCDDMDLLSIDVDGMDYWIWEALTVRPRAVILEYNNRWTADQSVTVPYRESFVGNPATEGVGYFGASLAAFVNLGRRIGYRLVGANSPNTNAIFLRADVGVADFPAVSVASCLSSDYARRQQARHGAALAQLPVVTIPHTA